MTFVTELGPGLALHPPPGRVPLYSSALNAEFEADSSFLFSQQQRGSLRNLKREMECPLLTDHLKTAISNKKTTPLYHLVFVLGFGI